MLKQWIEWEESKRENIFFSNRLQFSILLQSVGSITYLTFLKLRSNAMNLLITRIHRIRPKFKKSGSQFLLHDNTPVNSSIIVSEFLMNREISVLAHPLYSPDLTMTFFFYVKNEGDEIWECVIDLTTCNERTEGNSRSALSQIFNLSLAM